MTIGAGITSVFKAPFTFFSWIGASVSRKMDSDNNQTKAASEPTKIETSAEIECFDVANYEKIKILASSIFTASSDLLVNIGQGLKDYFLTIVTEAQTSRDITKEAQKDWNRGHFQIIDSKQNAIPIGKDDQNNKTTKERIDSVNENITKYLQEDEGFLKQSHFIDSVKAMYGQVCASYCLTMKDNHETEGTIFYATIPSEYVLTMRMMDDPSNKQKKCVALEASFKSHKNQNGTVNTIPIQVKNNNNIMCFNSPDNYECKNPTIEAKAHGYAQIIMRPNEAFKQEEAISEQNCPALFEATKFETSYELTERAPANS